MATEHTLTATGRSDAGKGASRRLRLAGHIPAVVYGGDADAQSIQLEHEPVWLASQHDWFYSSIITLKVDGKAQQVLLRDIQRHPYRQLIMHLDFQRVKAGEKIHVKVPLHFINIETSPAGKSTEATVTSEMNDVDVICLPKDLPEFIEVDLGSIEVGDTVYLSNVALPTGVELAQKIDEGEQDPAVAVARKARVVVEDTAPAEDEDVDADVPAIKQDDATDGDDAGTTEGEDA